jgi:hypothetical protein
MCLHYSLSEKSGTNGNFNYFSYFFYKLKLKVKRLKMALALDEGVEIVFLGVVRDGPRGKWQMRLMPDILKGIQKHSAMGKLVKKCKETGSVVDKPRVGRPSVGEDIRTGVNAKFHAHSHWFQTFRTSCRLWGYIGSYLSVLT